VVAIQVDVDVEVMERVVKQEMQEARPEALLPMHPTSRSSPSPLPLQAVIGRMGWVVLLQTQLGSQPMECALEMHFDSWGCWWRW
jgi:hypothetical protein